MKIDERFTPRSRLLMFQTLELLRKEIQPRFADWKDADDWLFSQLDFTKDELAQIYKGRDVLYNDASAVDFDAAQKARDASVQALRVALGPLAAEAFVLGDKLVLNRIQIYLSDDGNLLCHLPYEEGPRPLRSKIRDISEGDAFFFGNAGAIRTTSDAAHQNLDENDEPWIVYGDDGEVYFEEDIGQKLYSNVREYLFCLEQEDKKPSLADKIRSANNKADHIASGASEPKRAADKPAPGREG